MALLLSIAGESGSRSQLFTVAFQTSPPLSLPGLLSRRFPYNKNKGYRSSLFTATSSSRSIKSTDESSNNNNEGNPSAFLEDSKGHINPELAQRIFRWEREQRLNLNLRSGHSTREGLRWVQDLVARADLGSDSQDDLIQEGVIALMQAMTKYEQEAKPAQTFEVFAKERIQDALEDYLIHNKLASSTNSRKSALSVETTVEISDPLETHYSNQDEWEVREGLVLDNGHSVKPDELVGDFLDENLQYEGEDQMWVQQQQVAAPLRDSIPASEDDDFLDGTMDLSLDDLAIRDMILYNVDEFLGSTLDDLESQVIQLRFGLDDDTPKTQKEVAYDLGISVSRVRKLQKQALEKLRDAYSKHYVDDEEDQFYLEDSA